MPEGYRYTVVGTGFSGAVVARELAKGTSARVRVIDERSHIAGNCYTERDIKTGILVHNYGPHIFNTNSEDIWRYINQFGHFRPFVNRVRATSRSGVYAMPINLHSINQFFNTKLSPGEAREFLARKVAATSNTPTNFEEQALASIGRELYDEFFYGYTKKQWGCEPAELPASVLKRLPLRFNYDDNYYATRFQGIPEEGYTKVIERILDHDRVDVFLNTPYSSDMACDSDHIVYTGPVDRYFQYQLGRLSYRTVYFERHESTGDFQGTAVMNFAEECIPFTRIHEHKHFMPWEEHDKTVYYREFSRETGISDVPYYPKRLKSDLQCLQRYQNLAASRTNVTFLGRLGSYRYLNMDQAIGEALHIAKGILGF